MPTLIDSHCHLDNTTFDTDRCAVLQRAHKAGVGAIVLPATHAAGWQKLQQVATTYPDLYPVYGLHPLFNCQHSVDDLEKLRTWLNSDSQAVGVGECGLDQYNSKTAPAQRAAQMHYFCGQLDIAREAGLPIVIHARGAVEAVINAIRESGNPVGMVHSYNGSYEQAKRLIDLGYKLSFGGALTYSRAKKLRRLIAQLPLDALLLETDAPDQTGAAHQGQRNEPAYLTEVFATVCALRTESAEQIAATTSATARSLFRLPQQSSG